MDATRFDRLVASLVTSSNRRGLLRLLAALTLLNVLAVVRDESATAKKKKRKKKKCARAGQPTSKKRKKCCPELIKDASGLCAAPPSGCTPATCPPTACGSVPDGCGGTLTCSCQANQLCVSGVCQPCTVTCSGTAMQCGTALQGALNGGGTLYVCPGRYVGNFTISTAVSVIGAGEGADPDSNTILDVGGTGRVLVINAGVGPVELERLRLTDSNLAQAGGGIEHGGTMLRLTACTVSGNTSGGHGGGIAASGALEMTRCTVRDNHAPGSRGGGIYATGTTTLTDCSIEQNDADEGGGLFVTVGRTTLLGTTQVRGNAAGLGGGISVDSGTLVIAETCRVTENTAPSGLGGGILSYAGAVSLQGANPSPIVVDNCHENCAGLVPKCAATPVSCPA